MTIYIPPGGTTAVDPGDLTPNDRRRLRGGRGTGRGKGTPPACCRDSANGVECDQHRQARTTRSYRALQVRRVQT